MLIDTHAHLNFKDYNDLDKVIEKSIAKDVQKIICVSSNLSDSIRSIKITRKYEGVVFAAIGIHPQCTDPENKDVIETQLEKLENLILENRDTIFAIGECGLDFTEVAGEERKRSIEEQDILFRGQINIARKYNLPILLHFNKAHDYFLENYSELKDFKGIFHCYVGGKKRLNKFLEFGNFMFGVNGLITYDDGLQQVIKEIPMNRLVLETDCPYLSPLPYRGERNEPAYATLIAQKLSEIKGLSIEKIEKQVEENVCRVFREI